MHLQWEQRSIMSCGWFGITFICCDLFTWQCLWVIKLVTLLAYLHLNDRCLCVNQSIHVDESIPCLINHEHSIPGQEAVILNSKDKVPYLIQVEVLECEDIAMSALPTRVRARIALYLHCLSIIPSESCFSLCLCEWIILFTNWLSYTNSTACIW